MTTHDSDTATRQEFTMFVHSIQWIRQGTGEHLLCLRTRCWGTGNTAHFNAREAWREKMRNCAVKYVMSGWHRVCGLVYLIILKSYDACTGYCRALTRQQIITAQRIRIGALNISLACSCNLSNDFFLKIFYFQYMGLNVQRYS